MTNRNRTITDLRDSLPGRIYVYLGNEKICQRFLQDAEKEGYLFGQIKPTESGGSNIIALEKRKQLSHVGFVGHMAFQCPSGVKGEFYRIDYEKYVNGEKDFFFSDDELSKEIDLSFLEE